MMPCCFQWGIFLFFVLNLPTRRLDKKLFSKENYFIIFLNYITKCCVINFYKDNTLEIIEHQSKKAIFVKI